MYFCSLIIIIYSSSWVSYLICYMHIYWLVYEKFYKWRSIISMSIYAYAFVALKFKDQKSWTIKTKDSKSNVEYCCMTTNGNKFIHGENDIKALPILFECRFIGVWHSILLAVFLQLWNVQHLFLSFVIQTNAIEHIVSPLTVEPRNECIDNRHYSMHKSISCLLGALELNTGKWHGIQVK